MDKKITKELPVQIKILQKQLNELWDKYTKLKAKVNFAKKQRKKKQKKKKKVKEKKQLKHKLTVKAMIRAVNLRIFLHKN